MAVQELVALTAEPHKKAAGRDYVVVDVRRNDCDVRASKHFLDHPHSHLFTVQRLPW
jgi:hypothetical protein